MKHIYYIEDSDIWRDLVENIISKNFDNSKIRFHPINPYDNTLDDIISTILQDNTEGIIIFDLMLNATWSYFESVIIILSLYKKIVNQKLGIIIYSGNISEHIRSALISAGIPKNQIVDKGINGFPIDLIETITSIFSDIDNGTFHNKTGQFETEVLQRINDFEKILKTGIVELKQGQRLLYYELTEKNRKYLKKIISYHQKNKLSQHQIERMISVCLSVIEKKDYPAEAAKYLRDVDTSLKSKISLDQKLELAVHVIPFLLQYKVTLSEGVELQQTWDDLLKLIKG